MTQSQPKKVDESWKASVQNEKAAASPARPAVPESAAETEEGAGSAFLGFVSTLAMQTLVALGEIAHPETNESHRDLPQAQYLIDVIQLLSEKTKGNLTPQEGEALKNLLYELRLKFVQQSKVGA